MKTFSSNIKRVHNLQNSLTEKEVALVCDNANLLYLGFQEADFLLVSKTEVVYFITHRTRLEAIWTGKITPSYEDGKAEESKNILGILRKLKVESIYTDLNLSLQSPKIEHLVQTNNLLKKKLTKVNICNLALKLAPLRMVKDDSELENIRKANFITKQALGHLEKFLKPNVTELDLKSEFDYFLAKKNVSELAFPSIIACDESSCVLHKENYNGTLKNSVLFDVGAKSNNYCADVSRTFFLKPSALQENALNLVVNAQKEVIKNIKSGITLKELNNICKKTLFEGLAKLNIISTEEQLPAYYMHGVSHHLGLEAHDYSLPDIPLAKGMVITVEPGLYFWQEQFGIRVEDDVIVTNEGCQLI